MSEVKTLGLVARETVGHGAGVDGLHWEAAAQAVLDADPVRRQALELVESLATLLEEWHWDFGDECADPEGVAHESELIAKAHEFVRKARESSKP